MFSEIIKEYLAVDRYKLRGENFYSQITKTIKDKISFVNAHGSWEKRENCPLCRSTNFRIEFSRFGIDIVVCLECSLRYVTKIPVDIEDLYNNTQYLKQARNSYIKFYEYRKERFGKERISLIVSQIGPLKGKRILDIGSGSGYFLECAKEAGADCIGVELSDPVREWAKKKTRLPIVKNLSSDIPKRKKFDVITMFDLLEHAVNPLALIRQANSYLKQSGILVIFTPNFDSFGIQVMREKSNLIFPTDHLVFFNQRSLEFLCQKCNLEVAYLETFGMDIADILAFLEESNGFNGDSFLQRWEHPLQAIINKAGAANHLRLIAKKRR